MKKKKMIAFGMALSLLCASMSGTNVAQADSKPILNMSETVSAGPVSNSEQAELVLSQDGKAVVGVKNKSTATCAIIPEGVTSIGDETFLECSSLASIVLPESVTVIGEDAFNGCKSLKDITLPEGLTNIGDYAFWGCESLESVTIPKGVTSIGYATFCRCYNLKKISIPKGVNGINKYAFWGCRSLEKITIPSGVETIGDDAFSGCNSVKKITIPKTVTRIGEYVFSGCYVFAKNIKNGSKQKLTDSGLTIIDREKNGFCIQRKALVGYRNQQNRTSITIPKGVTSIGEAVFSGCDNLERITIPKEVASIGSSAFSDCESLKKITIPESVTSIGGYTFSGCSSLESVILPKGLKKIDGGAFSGCIGLKSITIPKSVKKIGKIKEGYYETPVFENCYMMKENVKNNSKFDLTERGLTIIDRDEDGFCMIGNELVKYRDSGLKNVTIPQGVTKIGDSAFEDRSKLESITIPESVTSIGERAFSGCVGLTNLTVPNGVVSIGPNAFVGVPSIEYHGSAEGAPWGAKALNGQLSTDYANTLSEKIAVPVNN